MLSLHSPFFFEKGQLKLLKIIPDDFLFVLSLRSPFFFEKAQLKLLKIIPDDFLFALSLHSAFFFEKGQLKLLKIIPDDFLFVLSLHSPFFFEKGQLKLLKIIPDDFLFVVEPELNPRRGFTKLTGSILNALQFSAARAQRVVEGRMPGINTSSTLSTQDTINPKLVNFSLGFFIRAIPALTIFLRKRPAEAVKNHS